MSLRDVKVRLEAGRLGFPVRAGGDFIFLKVAPKPLKVFVDGQPVVMRAGDSRRLERRSPGHNAFEMFELDSPSETEALDYVFVVGSGSYNSQIIEGQVSVLPVTLGADGTQRPDTRFEVGISLFPTSAAIETYYQGDLLSYSETFNLNNMNIDDNFTVFLGPNNHIGLGVYWNSFNSGGFYLVDPKTGLVSANYANWNLPGFGSGYPARDYSYCEGLGFIKVKSKSVYKQTAPGTHELLFTAPEELQSICVITDQNEIALLALQSGYIWIHDATTFELKRSRLITSPQTNSSFVGINYQKFLRYDPIGQRLFGSESAGMWEFDLQTLLPTVRVGAVLQPSGVRRYDSTAFQPLGSNIWGAAVSGTPRVAKGCFDEYSTKPRVLGASQGMQGIAALYSRTDTQTAAAIVASDTIHGVQITGEVIRAALEWFYKKAMPVDYLDHVYSVGFQGAGYPVTPLSTGNRTFALENVQDNLTVTLPCRIKMTIDTGLTLGVVL